MTKPSPDKYRVTWHPDLQDDLEGLGDVQLVRVALEVMLELRDDPYIGSELRERYNMRGLENCRSVKLDRDDWTGKPRYRLVYENQPSDGAPEEVRVYAFSERARLRAYATALIRKTGETTTPPRRRGA